MYYEINVSHGGNHFFATAERSLTDFWKAKRVLKEILKRFPEKDGYVVSITSWEKQGHGHDVSEFLSK